MRVTTFRLPARLLDGLAELFRRDGIRAGEAVRRAVERYLIEKGILPPLEIAVATVPTSQRRAMNVGGVPAARSRRTRKK